jgi:hypothetical protein
MQRSLRGQLSKRRPVGGALVGERLGRGGALLFQELADEPQGGSLVPLGLDQDLQDLAIGIDGAPQVHLPAADPNEHLILSANSRGVLQ